MAEFTISKDSPFSSLEYENVLKLYELFCCVFAMRCLTCKSGRKMTFSSYFHFDIGEISCVCRSKEEFIREVFGQKDFQFGHLSVLAKCQEGDIGSMSVHSSTNQVLISTADKNILAELSDAFEECLKKSQINESIPVQHVDNSKHLHITGTIQNSIVGNEVCEAVIESDKRQEQPKIDNQESLKPSFWREIWQSVVANIIWWLIGVIAIIIGTFLGLKNLFVG